MITEEKWRNQVYEAYLVWIQLKNQFNLSKQLRFTG